MTSLEQHKLKSKVDDLFQQIDRQVHSSQPDFETIASLTKYACVRVAGLIERSLYLLFVEYAQKNGHSNLANFVSIQMRNFSNPRASKIEELLRSFNPDWCAYLVTDSDYERLKGSLNSLIAERHAIAHGQDSTITASRLKQYYNDALVLLESMSETVWSK